MTERPIWFCSRATLPILAAGLLCYALLTLLFG
jgi:hypothetical protein